MKIFKYKKLFLIFFFFEFNCLNFNIKNHKKKLIGSSIIIPSLIYLFKQIYSLSNKFKDVDLFENIEIIENLLEDENKLNNIEKFLSEDKYFNICEDKNSGYGISIILNNVEKNFKQNDKTNEEFLINFIKDYGYLSYLSFLETYSNEKFKKKHKIEELKKNKIKYIEKNLNKQKKGSLHYILETASNLIADNLKYPDDYKNNKNIMKFENNKINNIPWFVLNDNSNYEFISDIHDSMVPMHKLFSYNEKFDKNKNIEIWLGDFIHRGYSKIQTIGNLLTVVFSQLYLNNKFKFIRGNHESKLMINYYNGNLEKKLFDIEKIDDLFCRIFPAGILINKNIIGTHGYFSDTFDEKTIKKLNKNNENEIIYVNIELNENTKKYYNNNFIKNKLIHSSLCDTSGSNYWLRINQYRTEFSKQNHLKLHSHINNQKLKCVHGHENYFFKQKTYFNAQGCINNNNKDEILNNKQETEKNIECFFLPSCDNENIFVKNKYFFFKNKNSKIYWTCITNDNKYYINDFFGNKVNFEGLEEKDF